MLLRRITKHVTDQNWFAVFIDFLIVVTGILIAFQITNWSEARQKQDAADNYIERIRQDLLANQEDITQRIAYFNKTRSSGLDALNALEQPHESLDIQFLVDVYQASQILPREVGRDTYDEILSVGANNAISDLNVRKRLANHYRGTKSQVVAFEDITSYREIIRSNMPYSAQAAIVAECGDIISNGVNGEPIASLPDNCDPVMTSAQISKGINAIIDLDIRVPLIRRISDLDLKISQAKIFNMRAKLLDEYLEGLNK